MRKVKKDIRDSVDILPVEIIERKIYLIRDIKVMLDSDLAELYGVETKVLNQAVKRNQERFPEDFMFKLSLNETVGLRSQIVTLEKGRGKYSKHKISVFTEHGVAMLSSILKSSRAIQVNILIVRAFIKIRELLNTHKDIIVEIDKIKVEQKNHSEQIVSIVNTINTLLEPLEDKPGETEPKQFGFTRPD